MSGGLPDILKIRVTGLAQDAGIDDTEPVPLEDIKIAWTNPSQDLRPSSIADIALVYATLGRIYDDSTTLRSLSNLVWRIWSNHVVHQQLSVVNLKHMAIRIL